jgi:signal transduction histidine kinase
MQSGICTRFESARLDLAHLRVEGDKACLAAARHAAEVCAHALNVERVGVWLFRDDMQRLECINQYTLSDDRHAAGESLDCSTIPTYVAALQTRRAVIADDAVRSAETCELKDYLDRHGIASMMDAPILRGAEVLGVVCHEQIGSLRRWGPREVDFACSVADTAALILEQSRRLEVEASLRNRREAELFDQKMDAIARLSRTIAHDLNNVITTMALTAGLIELSEDAEVRACAAQLAAEAAAGATLVRQLMLLGREPGDGPASCDAAALLTRIEPTLRTAVGDAVLLDIAVAVDDARVAMSDSDMERVILNLCLNARDAMPGGGKLSLQLRPSAGDDGIEGVAIEVSDEGMGIDDDTQVRMFEPYFTTKTHGTGLGLASVHALVERAGGSVGVASIRGTGARFVIALPRPAD